MEGNGDAASVSGRIPKRTCGLARQRGRRECVDSRRLVIDARLGSSEIRVRERSKGLSNLDEPQGRPQAAGSDFTQTSSNEKSMTMIAEPQTDLNKLDAFHALLPALAEALDVRDVFQHLSAVAARIVPHDEANLALATDDGSQYRLYASTRARRSRARVPRRSLRHPGSGSSRGSWTRCRGPSEACGPA